MIIRHDPITGFVIPALLFNGKQYRNIWLTMKHDLTRVDVSQIAWPVPLYDYVDIVDDGTKENDANGFYTLTFGLQYNPKTGMQKHPVHSFGIAKRDVDRLELGDPFG